MVLFVPPHKQVAVRQKLSRLIYVPFEFEFSGSQIIFFDPEADYSREEEARGLQSGVVFRELTDGDR